MTEPGATVHRFQASLFPVNAYLVETTEGVVVIDATLGVSDARALRARVEALRQPLAAVLLTHSHPDHYGGVTSLLDGADVPVYAVAGVDQVIRRDDPAKEQILRPMFGDEWPSVRTFPNRIVTDGEDAGHEDLVAQICPGWNPLTSWMQQIEDFQRAASGGLPNGNPPLGNLRFSS